MKNATDNGEVARFIEETKRLGGRYVFRGQGNSNWKLESGAVRRILQTPRNREQIGSRELGKLVNVYQRNMLLNPAITRAFDLDGQGRISELELLAKLQHFGAGTALLDFTRDPLVALWFACEENDNDGTVFALNIGGTDGAPTMKVEDTQKTMEEVFRHKLEERVALWEPTMRGEAMFRVLRQRSVFVIGPPVIPEKLVRKITIEQSRKVAIKAELENLFDKGGDSLFADIQGFAYANRAENPIGELDDPIWYVGLGNEAYRERKYRNAIKHYTAAIDRGFRVDHVYISRGNVHTNIEQWNEAKSDFTSVIDKHTKKEESLLAGVDRLYRCVAYINRGNVRHALGEFSDAVEDYCQSMTVMEKIWDDFILFDRASAQVCLGHFQEALKDYEECKFPNAKFNQANVLARLGRFADARDAYMQYSENTNAEKTPNHGKFNAQKIVEIIDRIGEKYFEVESGISETHIRVRSESNEDQLIETINLSLDGDIGNCGNISPPSPYDTPGHWSIPGGDGFAGGLPIRILISPLTA